MAAENALADIPPELQSVLEELKQREPIFHRASFGVSAEDFDRLMAPDYWEVGASGQRYSRAFILQTLAHNAPVDAEVVGWTCSDFGLRRLGPETFLLTYMLDQSGRITRRATIWQRADGHWRILYHQGTIVAGSKDKAADPKEQLRMKGNKKAAPKSGLCHCWRSQDA